MRPAELIVKREQGLGRKAQGVCHKLQSSLMEDSIEKLLFTNVENAIRRKLLKSYLLITCSI